MQQQIFEAPTKQPAIEPIAQNRYICPIAKP